MCCILSPSLIVFRRSSPKVGLMISLLMQGARFVHDAGSGLLMRTCQKWPAEEWRAPQLEPHRLFHGQCVSEQEFTPLLPLRYCTRRIPYGFCGGSFGVKNVGTPLDVLQGP